MPGPGARPAPPLCATCGAMLESLGDDCDEGIWADMVDDEDEGTVPMVVALEAEADDAAEDERQKKTEVQQEKAEKKRKDIKKRHQVNKMMEKTSSTWRRRRRRQGKGCSK